MCIHDDVGKISLLNAKRLLRKLPKNHRGILFLLPHLVLMSLSDCGCCCVCVQMSRIRRIWSPTRWNCRSSPVRLASPFPAAKSRSTLSSYPASPKTDWHKSKARIQLSSPRHVSTRHAFWHREKWRDSKARSSRRARHVQHVVRVVSCQDVTWRAKWNLGLSNMALSSTTLSSTVVAFYC